MARTFLRLLAAVLACGAVASWAQTNEPEIPRAFPVALPVNPPPTAPAVPDPSAEDAEALAIVRASYVDPAALNALTNALTLSNVVAALGGGVMVADGALAESVTNAVTFRSEVVEGRYLYVRPLMFGASNLLAPVLAELATSSVEAVVMDLRGCEEFVNYLDAVSWVSPFLPEGRVLFTLAGASDPGTAAVALGGGTNRWRALPMAVVVNGRTAGAAEALAAALHDAGRAVLVGAPTRGLGVVFTETKLANGRHLRVATQRVLRPDGSTLFPTPLTPDIAVKSDPAADEKVLADQWQNGVATWLNDTGGTPQQSEAALVRGENPDVDALRERLESRRKRKATAQARNDLPARDAALQRAFDLFRSLDALDLTPREVKLRRSARATNGEPEVRKTQPAFPAGG